MLDIIFSSPLPHERQSSAVQGTIEILPENAGFLADGRFDMEAWEESRTIVEIYGGKEVFKEAWSKVRVIARKFGGVNVLSTSIASSQDPMPLP